MKLVIFGKTITKKQFFAFILIWSLAYNIVLVQIAFFDDSQSKEEHLPRGGNVNQSGLGSQNNVFCEFNALSEYILFTGYERGKEIGLEERLRSETLPDLSFGGVSEWLNGEKELFGCIEEERFNETRHSEILMLKAYGNVFEEVMRENYSKWQEAFILGYRDSEGVTLGEQ